MLQQKAFLRLHNYTFIKFISDYKKFFEYVHKITEIYIFLRIWKSVKSIYQYLSPLSIARIIIKTKVNFVVI